MGADVGRRCEERIDVDWARWSDIWTAPDSISAVVPAVGLGRAIAVAVAVAAGGEMAVEMVSVDMAAVLVAVEAVAVAVVIAGAKVDEVGRRDGEVAE